MIRVRGGMRGLLAALERGVCDELAAEEPFVDPRIERGRDPVYLAHRAARRARLRRRGKALAAAARA